MTNADFLIKYLRIKLVNLLTWNGPAHPAASSSIIRAPEPTSLTSARSPEAPVGPERFGINLERRDNQLSQSGKYKNTQSYCKDNEKRSFQKISCLVRAFFLLCIKMSPRWRFTCTRGFSCNKLRFTTFPCRSLL